jgi:hypothetical protein
MVNARGRVVCSSGITERSETEPNPSVDELGAASIIVKTVSDLCGLKAYPRLRRRCPGSLGTEGVEGNIHASRAWKGNVSAALARRGVISPFSSHTSKS